MVLAIDIFLIICFFLTLMDGARNGFFKELFTLSGLGVGLWAAIQFTGPIQQALPAALRNAQAVSAVLFVLICGVIVMGLRLTGCAFAALWEGRKPPPTSRIGGLVLGSVRGLILVLVLAAGLTLLFPPGSPFLGRSRLLPYLSPGMVWGTELLPRELGDRILWRWGQLPFDDRLIRPGGNFGGRRPGGSAENLNTVRPGLQDSAQAGRTVTQWPFAS